MTMPRIEIKVRHLGEDETWKEQYDCTDDPQVWAKKLIDNFNATLHSGEKPRELVDVVVLDDASDLAGEHVWRKENLVTIVRGSRSYDKMRCEKCGITGKRFGLGQGVIRDRKYQAKKYEKCHG